jgi:hypothetical protein
MSIFPGVKVVDRNTEIRCKILSLVNPNNEVPIENIKKWNRVDDNVYELEALKNFNTYYLLYKHPVHDYRDKLFLVGREELISFMKERIKPSEGEGLDIIITNAEFTKLVVCNHDGLVFSVM